jgi:hypothetical protein
MVMIFLTDFLCLFHDFVVPSGHKEDMHKMQVSKLLLMAVLHFIAMYFLMYAMVHTFDNVMLNLNNFFMAGLMTAPMLLIEGFLMGSMYESKKVLTAVMALSGMALVVFFIAIRQQTLIGDQEFIRSMIPHHSGAILMCEQAYIEDSELKNLCDEIIEGQQSEIDQMNSILERLKQ